MKNAYLCFRKMKILSIILSLIIFCQSLSVCGDIVCHKTNSKEKNSCTIDNSAQKCTEEKISCCDKKDKEEHNDKKKDCCGDHCTCFCCVKIIISKPLFYKTTESVSDNYTKAIVIQFTAHSFDFHPSISGPPKV